MADAALGLTTRVDDVTDDVGTNAGQDDVLPVRLGVRSNVEMYAAECGRHPALSGEMVAHGHRDHEERNAGSYESHAPGCERWPHAPDRRPADHRGEQDRVRPEERERGERDARGERPAARPFPQPHRRVEQDRGDKGDDRELDEEGLVEDGRDIESGEQRREHGGSLVSNAAHDCGEEDRGGGAEGELHGGRPDPVLPAQPVERGEQVAVAGAAVVRHRPAAEPFAACDRGRDLHIEPPIHPGGRRRIDHERPDRAKVEEAKRERRDADADHRRIDPMTAPRSRRARRDVHSRFVP